MVVYAAAAFPTADICMPPPPTQLPAHPPMASPFAFPSDLIRKQCMRAHLNMCTSISLAALFAYPNRHGSSCALRRRAFSVTEGRGGGHRHRHRRHSRCGLTPRPHTHSHTRPPSAPLSRRWLLPCLNGTRQHTDTCNASDLITHRAVAASCSSLTDTALRTALVEKVRQK